MLRYPDGEHSFLMLPISKLSREIAILQVEAKMADTHAQKLRRLVSQSVESPVLNNLMRLASEESSRAEEIRNKIQILGAAQQLSAENQGKAARLDSRGRLKIATQTASPEESRRLLDRLFPSYPTTEP